MSKASITRKVTSMDELNSKKIAQHNDLIMSVAKMNAVPLKFFEIAVACLDTENVPKDRTVHISKDLLFSFLNVKSESKYSYLKSVLQKMHENTVFFMWRIDDEVDGELDEGDEKYAYKIITPLETTSWNNAGNDVAFKFTETIMPYLIGLKKNFTQYLLADIGKLNSKYSIILYKWLSMNFNQYNYYEQWGNRTQEQLEELKNPIISVEELRRLTSTENNYTRMSNFTRWVLDESIGEITKKTVFNVEYRKIKRGNRVSEIKFFITKKSVAKNEFYKEEQQDPAFLEEQENEKKEMESLYAASIENNYTSLLWEHNLIAFQDIQDKELMAGLQKKVYPLYDELEQRKGIGSADYHVSYVADRKKDYSHSKKNTLRYLHESIKNYLARADMKYP